MKCTAEKANERLARAETALAIKDQALAVIGTKLSSRWTLRQLGFADRAGEVFDAATTELVPLLTIRPACRLTGKSRATLWTGSATRQTPGASAAAASDTPGRLDRAAERGRGTWQAGAATGLWTSPGVGVGDPAGRECLPVLDLDAMYRLLRAHGEARAPPAGHPARRRPELVATAPKQVWNWDVTLTGPR